MAMKSRPQRGTNDWMRLGRHSMDSSARLLVVSISVSGLPWTGGECSCRRREFSEKNDEHQEMVERLSTISNTPGGNEFRPAGNPITLWPRRKGEITGRRAGGAQ